MADIGESDNALNTLTTPTPDGFSSFDQIQQYLNIQAGQLVRQGADPAQVDQLLQQRSQALSQIWDKWGAAAFQNRSPVTAEDVAGTPKEAPGLLAAAEGPPADIITQMPQPKKDDSSWSPADSDVDLHSSGQIFSSLANPVLTSGRGLLAAGAGALDAIGFDQDTTDPIFSAADKLKEYQEELPKPTSTADKIIQAPGSALSGFATLGLGSGGAKGMDVLAKGGSLGQAEGANAIDTAASEGTLALGIPFSSVPARMATQAVGNVVSQEGAREATNAILPADQQEEFDPVSAATAFGTGFAFGAIPHGGESNVPRTGDRGIDTGLQMADDVKQAKAATDPDLAQAIQARNREITTDERSAAGKATNNYIDPNTNVEDITLQTPEKKVQYPKDKVQSTTDAEGNESIDVASTNDDGTSTEANRQRLKSSLADKLGVVASTDARPYEVSPDQSSRISRSVYDAWDNGTLTTGHILDSVADNHDSLYNNAPEAKAYADVLRQAGENLGGLDTPIVRFDPENPEHVAATGGDPKMQNAAAFYDSASNKIYVNGEGNLRPATMIHESAHAITHKAIDMGLAGDLTGPQNRAFKTLQALFDGIKDHIATVGADPNLKPDAYNPKTYGAENLHEMTAEMFGSGRFRAQLKSIDLNDIPLPEGEKGSLARMALAKVRNAYDAVVGSIRGMLGLSPKATNALDGMFTASHDFLKSFNGDAAKQVRESNARGTEQFAVPKEEKRYTAPRPDPVSKWQEWKSNIAYATKALTGIKSAPERGIQNAKDEANQKSNQARFDASVLGKQLTKAAKREGVGDEDLFHYMTGKEATGLDTSPKTKQLADQFRNLATINAKQIATEILKNPAARTADYRFAHAVLDNPTYAFRGYQGPEFARNLRMTAREAQQIMQNGGMPSDAQMAAFKTESNAKQWIRDYLLPGPDLEQKTLPHMREMAKAVGIDVPRLFDGLKGGPIVKKAKLIEALREKIPDEATKEKLVDRLMNEISGITNRANSPVAKYYRGVRMGDIMTQRSQVPPVLRALWGEIRNPGEVLISTLTKQGRGLAQLQEQSSLRDLGVSKGWFHEDKATAPDGFTERLNGRKFGALQGLYTTPELKRLMAAHIQLSTAGQSFMSAMHSGDKVNALKDWASGAIPSLWTMGVGTYKSLRLGTDFGYYLMYTYGGPSILMTNGVINLGSIARGAGAHAVELFPQILDHIKNPELKAQLIQDRTDVLRSGLNETSMAGELTREADHRKMAEALENGSIDSLAKQMGGAIGRYAAKGRDALTSALGVTDGYARRAALIDRIKILEKHYDTIGQPKTHEQIRQEAADWVKDTVITNSRSPLWARLVERTGGGQGVTYMTETVRNAMNAYVHGYQDIQRGFSTGDHTMTYHGAKQLIGATTAIGWMAGGISATGGTLLAAIFGLKSKEVEPTDPRQGYLQQDKSGFQGQRPEEITNTGDDQNKYFWAPGDRNDFFYQVSQPIHSIIDSMHKQQAGEKVDPAEAAKAAFSAFTGVFFHNGFTSKVLDMVQGRAPYWMTQQAPDQYMQYKANLVNMGASPKFADAMLTLQDMARPGFLRNADMAENASPAMKTPMSLGIGIKKIPNDTGLSSAPGAYGTGKSLVNEFTQNKKMFTDLMNSPAPFSESAITKSYENAFKADYKTMQKLQQDMEFGKANNVDEAQMAQDAKLGGIPKKAIEQVYMGDVNPAQLLFTEGTEGIKKQLELAADDPQKTKQIMDTYGDRLDLMYKLFEKYSSLTPKEIEAL